MAWTQLYASAAQGKYDSTELALTFDIFTSGDYDIDKTYAEGKVTVLGHPIPRFISNQGGTKPEALTYAASLPLGSYYNYKYTGGEGGQASAEN